MKSIKGLLVALSLTGLMVFAPNAVFARGGGGGGHFDGGGHFGGSSHFAGRHSFAHSFAQGRGAHFARNGDRFRHGGHFFFADPYWDDSPYYGYDDGYDGAYADGQSWAAESTLTVIAVQRELVKLGYYHSDVDGLIGPQTERAIRWFQSVEDLPVTGQIDDPTLKALRIS